MTDHPITPPPELRAKWMTEARSQDYCSITEQVAYRAAQWGYDQRGEVNEAKLQQACDQELEACCKWLDREGWSGESRQLRAARRPPPSLKEQALAELTAWTEMRNGPGESLLCDGLSVATIRRALEALPDD